MSGRAPRYVPAITGIFWVAVAVGVIAFWPPPEGILYWVRGLVFALPLLFGLGSLRDALFASDEQISRAVDGQPETAREAHRELGSLGLVQTCGKVIASRRFALTVAFAAVAAFLLIDWYQPQWGLVGNIERATITITHACPVWQPLATDQIVPPPSATRREGPGTAYQPAPAPTAEAPRGWLPCGLVLPYRWVALSAIVLLGLHFMVRASAARE